MRGSGVIRRARQLAAQRGLVEVEGVPISIVIPARNVEATVRRTLDSVFAQTSDRWELVLIDDGSTDDTRKIVDEMVGGRPNVTVADGPRMGVSAARNLGTELARHDHVLYLDADDWIGDRYVELMGAALADDPSLAGVRCIWAYEAPDGRYEPWDDLDLSDLFRVAATRCPFAIHAVVIRKDLVLTHGGFDRDLVVGEDWDLWQRIGRAGGRLGFVKEVLAFYFMRPESVMHQDYERSHSDLIEVTLRGSRPDDRVVDPLPKYRDGLPLDPRLALEAEVLSGTLGSAIPTDVDLASLIVGDPPDQSKEIEAETIAGTLHEAVAFGSCQLLSDWADIYERWGDRINEMLDLYTGWLGRPELKDEILLELETTIVETMTDERLLIGRTQLQRIDLAEPITDIELDEGAVQLVVAARYGERPVGFVRLARLEGSASADAVAEAIARNLGPRMLSRAVKDRGLAAAMMPNLVGRDTAKAAARMALDLSWDRRAGALDTAKLYLRWNATQAAASLLDVPLTLTPWDTSEVVTESTAADDEPTAGADEPRVDPDRRKFDDQYGEEYFDSIFEEADPWTYTGDYEQTKYEQTLEALGDRRFTNALELACAEGHFTVQLAPRVDRLFAADISPTALERAAERCHEFDHIEFGQIDLRGGELPSDLDLIVCSEVLYFMEDRDGLADLGRRFADALVPGGLVVMAHANLIADDPDQTGFDWGHQFGARRIGEIVAETPGLRLVSVGRSELYRIHLLERVEPGSPAERTPPEEVELPLAENLDTHIARMALWGGAMVTRADADANEVGYQVPILMYHRVSPEGNPALDTYRITPETFERQLEYLRANGYHAIGFDQLRYSLSTKEALPGRPVLITFDDGYQDFYDHAWPLLRDYDFSATVFVVADLVGTDSSWDAQFGPTAPLMDWDTIRYLQANGIEFGSHTASHRRLDHMTETEIMEQEQRCRAIFRRELGIEAWATAYPYGMHDEMVERAMRRAGYDMAVTTKGWLATVWNDPMLLPRVDVVEADGVKKFAAKLGQRGGINPLRRTVRQVRSARAG